VQKWYPIEPDQIAAKVMGRWPNGAPVEKAPQPEDERDQPKDANDFDFSDDPDGVRCPVGAHIRRANPRKGTITQSEDHRMIRRARSYGVAAPGISSFKDKVGDADAEKRGLIFLAIVGDIARQFEFVQRDWINSDDFDGLDGTDPVAATTANGNFRLSSGRAQPVGQFITLRGGEYFFLPSMDAIDRIAGNEFGEGNGAQPDPIDQG
jgi:deferrochelatase/peroxidase EfeB